MRPGRVFLIAALAAALCACGTMPLGTMWKLSRMGPEALLEADPVEIRAAVLSKQWFLDGPSSDAGVLRANLRSPSTGEHAWSFSLEDVSDREAHRMDAAPAEQRWRIYRIAPGDLEAFQGFQRELPGLVESAEASDEKAEFALSVAFASEEARKRTAQRPADAVPTSVEVVPYRVELLLDRQDGFFTLVRGEMEVPIFSDEPVDDAPGP